MRLPTLLPMTLIALIGTQASAEFRVTSPDLTADQPISAAQFWNNFGCTGENLRPALNWVDAPQEAKSFAVTFYDQDAPTGSGFWHWVAYDIPADVTGIAADALPEGTIEGNTDLGQPGFFGPCPPIGRQHSYTFTVHALDTDHLEAPEGATAALTGFFIYQHSIAQATVSVLAGPRSE
ncbi:YbhB/YbcL family Raf kinase inhibitor-like protein [Tritonibacter mobilis]|uniref:Phosphatidylethanolamine-binding protein n=1 Tax=Tritonibacter mobilis F1926 TaxID=1265309 RepID=A0A1B1A785_9RHOB|nr:YbhB/YbcL family Raf kinase inhibitor-like protein [Tritonibacter mobilis]ANP42388.1 phosphatidylethanolamine-binding protein [Tritonibacter mobilis F1926]KJZ22688.1 phosphatidylethanolamine-binding protein [Tritonibacter mobilis]